MTPDLSIIIVTYYTTPITHLCLWSLAQSGLRHSEVILIDNAGNDPYLKKITSDYPFIQLIRNETNEGFGKACNRGFSMASGQFIIMMNPDTIVPPDFEEKTIRFFREHPKTGAMGVKMVDGQGNYLQESKRNFPGPVASFFRFTQIEKAIPYSKKKWHYYARHIPDDIPSETEVLSGSFMVVSREAMKQTGGFDPRYFLYAEDIDLSWEISCKGFEVWYNPELPVVHFKGETSKKSPDYARLFYDSMGRFYKKYYNSHHHPLKMALIMVTIKTLAFFSGIKHKFRSTFYREITFPIRLHPDSSMDIYHKLKHSFPFEFSKTLQNRKKQNGPPHLLLSTQNITPQDLIEAIKNCKTGYYNIILWHDPSLLFLSDAKHLCQIFPKPNIK
ncbi:MAG: glycosyltransferase family 2 protein [Marinilabilia sp.]